MPLNARQHLPYVPLADHHAHLRAVPRTVGAVGWQLGVDASMARPTLADFRSLGQQGDGSLTVQAFGGYISDPAIGSDDKDLFPFRAALYESWGLDWWLYFEDATGDFRAGRAGGRAKAEMVLTQLQARYGRHDKPVCYSVDDDARAELGTVDAWFDGIADVYASTFGASSKIDLIDGYGQYAVTTRLRATGRARRTCQTRAWSTENGVLQWDPDADRRQDAYLTLPSGAQVDRVWLTKPDYGQNWGVTDVTAAEVWSEQVPVPAIFKTRFASSSYTMAEILYGARLLAGDAVTAAKALVPVLDDQAQIVAAVNAVTGHVGDSEAAVLAALALVAAPTLTQAQLDYLASKFPAVDPQKIADAVHADIGKAFEPPA